MKKLLLDKIFDTVISDKLNNDNGIFQKIVEKYKKSDSVEDETEITTDLCELVCKVQKIAFKAGVKASVDVWDRLCDE